MLHDLPFLLFMNKIMRQITFLRKPYVCHIKLVLDFVNAAVSPGGLSLMFFLLRKQRRLLDGIGLGVGEFGRFHVVHMGQDLTIFMLNPLTIQLIQPIKDLVHKNKSI